MLACWVALAAAVRCEAASPLELLQTIPLPGITGRFDGSGIDVRVSAQRGRCIRAGRACITFCLGPTISFWLTIVRGTEKR